MVQEQARITASVRIGALFIACKARREMSVGGMF